MKKNFALVLCALLFALPSFVNAATVDQQQLISLYQQLITLLQQQLQTLQTTDHAWLSMNPTSGTVPLVVMFTLNNPSQREAIDYGDGHSSGSNGCVKNALGNCDLSKPVYHSYQLPGTYKVTLYAHDANNKVLTISTHTITVTAPTH